MFLRKVHPDIIFVYGNFWLNQINNKEVIKYKANFSEGESE